MKNSTDEKIANRIAQQDQRIAALEKRLIKQGEYIAREHQAWSAKKKTLEDEINRLRQKLQTANNYSTSLKYKLEAAMDAGKRIEIERDIARGQLRKQRVTKLGPS